MTTHQREGMFKVEASDSKNNEDQQSKKRRKPVREVRQSFENLSHSISDSKAQDGNKKVGRWTEEEDTKLQNLIDEYGEKSWRIISDMMEGRSAIQCLHRWTKILKPGLRKGPWQEEEDEKLLEWVNNNGPCKWSICAENIQGRSGKQCRERWFNNLNPNVKKGGWTQQEDQEIFRGYLQHNSSWSKIARNLTGRTENSVKNRFYSTVRKLLADQEKEGGPFKKPTSGIALENFVREHLQKLETGKGGAEQVQVEPSAQESNQIEEEEEIFQEEGQQDDQKAEDGDDDHAKSDGQDDDSKSKKKMIEGYPEQNLLYRLLKQQGGPIRRTSCMKDYSTIYKKYKKRYNQKKRDKKMSDKVEFLRRLILKNEDDDKNCFDKSDKKGMELLARKGNKDFAKQIHMVENELAQMQQQHSKQIVKRSARLQSPAPSSPKANDNTHLNNEHIMEFQNKLVEFFNQSLTEVMRKFQQDVKSSVNPHAAMAQTPQWQMILAPSDARIIYPPANMPPNVKLPNQKGFQTPVQPLQMPNMMLSKEENMEEDPEQAKKDRKKLKAKNRKQPEKKVKVEEKQDLSQANDNMVQSFLQKFQHLGQIGVSQLGQSICDGRPDKNGGNQLAQENKIDQKMMFLISQLHTLESMLSNTKKELGRLEASLHEKITVNNNSRDSQNESSHGEDNLKREEM